MEVSQFLTKDECLKIVKRIINSTDFDLLDWGTRPLSSEPAGLVGEHIIITANVSLHNPTDGQENRHHLQFFAKAVPRSQDSHKKFVEELGAFEKEINVFRKLFVDFKTVLTPSDVQWTCACYYTRPDIIVLEDLTTLGFRHVNNRDSFDFSHCAVVMKSMARFHAASIIFEERQTNPCRLDHLYPDIFFETFFVDTPGHPGNDVFNTSVNGIVHIAEMLSSYGKGTAYFETVKDRMPKTCEAMLNLVKSSDRYRNVACHGDLWSNNIFFLYSGETPVEARLVDFQLLRYTPPAHDIMCFLHLTTTRAFRKRYLHDLQTVYHETLAEHLLGYGLNVDQVLPWAQFLESCVYLKTLAMITAGIYIQDGVAKGIDLVNIYNSSENFYRFHRVDRKKELIQFYNSDSLFRTRITEVVEELIEECILKSDKEN